MAPPRNPVIQYSTVWAVCQQRMRSGWQTCRQRWCPAALASAWGRGGCFETSEVFETTEVWGGHRQCAAGRRCLGADGLQPLRLCAGRAYPREQVESRRHRWMPKGTLGAPLPHGVWSLRTRYWPMGPVPRSLLIRTAQMQELPASGRTASRTGGRRGRPVPAARRGCPAPPGGLRPAPGSGRRPGWWTGGER